MEHAEIVECARMAVGEWANVSVRPAQSECIKECLELTFAPDDLFQGEEKVEVRFGSSDGKEILVIIEGGRVPRDKAKIALKHVHRFNVTSPNEVKIELWSYGEMTMRTYFPLPDGTDAWDQRFDAHVRMAAESIAKINNIDFDHAPVPKVSNCTPERILYEVSDFGLAEDLGWILSDGSVEVANVARDVHGNSIAFHRPRFDVEGCELVWETHCDGWQIDNGSIASAFVNQYNLRTFDAVALWDENTKHLIWRRTFRRMPSSYEALFDAFEDGCAFFEEASEALDAEKDGVQ